jgi:Tfp pilus assembly protein PilF
MLGGGTQLVLGHMQSRAGRHGEAEATFRQELAARPASGWALRGLARALQAQGKEAEAAKYRAELERTWTQASAALRAGS